MLTYNLRSHTRDRQLTIKENCTVELLVVYYQDAVQRLLGY